MLNQAVVDAFADRARADAGSADGNATAPASFTKRSCHGDLAKMKFLKSTHALAGAVLAGGLLAASGAVAQDATIHFGGGSVAFLASINWGSGTLHYHGRHIPLRVSGLGVGAIGADRFSAEGEVYHLHRVRDIEGTYTAINASATAGVGAGEIDMTNQYGVEIRAHTTSAGLKLSLAPTGVVIHFR